jgi:hypothetical protein
MRTSAMRPAAMALYWFVMMVAVSGPSTRAST